MSDWVRTASRVGVVVALLLIVGPSQGAVAGAGAPRDRRAVHGSAVVHFTRADGSIDTVPAVQPPGSNAFTGDFVGSDLDDVFWYTPGPGGDLVWRSNGDRTWTDLPARVNGTYSPVVGSFADPDGKDDIFWYGKGQVADSLWDFNADGSVTITPFTVTGSHYQLIVGRFGGDDPGDDIIFLVEGVLQDRLWDFAGTQSAARKSYIFDLPVNTPLRVYVGNFGGQDGFDDLLLYSPGSGEDELWDFNPHPGGGSDIDRYRLRVDGSFLPVVGDFTGDGYDDVIWHVSGPAQDVLWNFNGPGGHHTSTHLTIDGDFQPVPCQCFAQSAGLTDIVWFGTGHTPDRIWDYTADGAHTSRAVTLNGDQLPVLGSFQGSQATVVGDGTTHYEAGDDILDRHR